MGNSFFKTREGEICIALLLCLGATPVIIAGAAASSVLTPYIGLGMIILGMAIPPLRTYVIKRKREK